MISARWAIASGLLFAATAAAAAPAEEPAIAITLAPRQAPGGAGIAAVGVSLRFDGVAAAAGAPLLRLPLVVSNVDTVATVISDLTAEDASGPLQLTARPVTAPGDTAAGDPSLEWVASRATAGTVTVHYSVPAEATLPPRGAAPPFSFTNDGGGVSAAGNVFILLPPQDARYRTTIDWDMRAAPAGSRGISSIGEGHVVASEPMRGSQLRSTFFMAGRIGTWPARVPASGFFGAWQGNPPFDASGLLAWTGSLYDHYSKFFGQKEPPPYGVFLRYNPINAGGGVGLNHSFVTTFGKGDGGDVSKVKITLAHEMFHTFQPRIGQPAGLESSWFAEGLAVFYAARLALRYDMISPDDFLKEINGTAARYYTSIMATVPNSEVPKRFWADTRIRTLPYDRGMLYFATVDDAMRKASKGKRSLDDLMLAMLALQKSGKTLSNADWEAQLQGSLGTGAVEDFRAFLGGRMPVPASDAFGPCFRRTTRPLRRYELGFDTAVLAETKRVVRGLVAGSAAAAAGLRDGDEILVPVPQDGIQGNQTQMLTLQIRREGKDFPITYLPRGETVDTYQWERAGNAAPATCSL